MINKNTKVKKLVLSTVFVIGILAIVYVFMKLNIFSSKLPVQQINNQTIINNNFFLSQPPYNDSLNFCGEIMPIERQDIREAFEYDLLKVVYWHSESILYIKRMTKFFSIVEPILKKYNVPDDFKYLLVVESGMTNVVSPAKAEGYWQFMKSTAIEYGLEVNEEVDERYDIEKSTIAACKYILNAYSKFKNWTLVAASYNSGVDYIQTQLTTQKVDNFYDLLIYAETARYIYRIVAYKLLLSDPKTYGFDIDKEHCYYTEPTDVVKVEGSIPDLVEFAKQYNTTYRQLKILNPWLRNSKLSNTKSKVYYIKIPKR